MKIKDGFVVREVGGETFAIAVGERSKTFRNMITLNGTGKFIWNALSEETTEEEVAQKLTREYDVDAETAKRDVHAFVARLAEVNLLD